VDGAARIWDTPGKNGSVKPAAAPVHFLPPSDMLGARAAVRGDGAPPPDASMAP